MLLIPLRLGLHGHLVLPLTSEKKAGSDLTAEAGGGF